MNLKNIINKLFQRKSIYPEKKALIIEGGGMLGVFLAGS